MVINYCPIRRCSPTDSCSSSSLEWANARKNRRLLVPQGKTNTDRETSRGALCKGVCHESSLPITAASDIGWWEMMLYSDYLTPTTTTSGRRWMFQQDHHISLSLVWKRGVSVSGDLSLISIAVADKLSLRSCQTSGWLCCTSRPSWCLCNFLHHSSRL